MHQNVSLGWGGIKLGELSLWAGGGSVDPRAEEGSVGLRGGVTVSPGGWILGGNLEEGR